MCALWQDEVWRERMTGEAFRNWLVADAARDSEGRSTHFVGPGADRAT